MANASRVKEESFKLSSAWIVKPFASVLSQRRLSQSFQSPIFKTRWNDEWQITLQFTRQSPETQQVQHPLSGIPIIRGIDISIPVVQPFPIVQQYQGLGFPPFQHQEYDFPPFQHQEYGFLPFQHQEYGFLPFQHQEYGFPPFQHQEHGFPSFRAIGRPSLPLRNNRHSYQLNTTLVNLNEICSYKGRYVFTVSVILDESFRSNRRVFTMHNSSALNSDLYIDHSEVWLSREELELAIDIEFFPDLSASFNSTTFSINERFAAIKEVEELQDVTILIGERELKTNKTVLALNSPVFLAMFTHEFKEKREHIISIKDTDAHTMQKFLDFVYTGQNPGFTNVESALKLFYLAEKYQVSALKQICLRYTRLTAKDETGFIELLSSLRA